MSEPLPPGQRQHPGELMMTLDAKLYELLCTGQLDDTTARLAETVHRNLGRTISAGVEVQLASERTETRKMAADISVRGMTAVLGRVDAVLQDLSVASWERDRVRNELWGVMHAALTNTTAPEFAPLALSNTAPESGSTEAVSAPETRSRAARVIAASPVDSSVAGRSAPRRSRTRIVTEIEDDDHEIIEADVVEDAVPTAHVDPWVAMTEQPRAVDPVALPASRRPDPLGAQNPWK